MDAPEAARARSAGTCSGSPIGSGAADRPDLPGDSWASCRGVRGDGGARPAGAFLGDPAPPFPFPRRFRAPGLEGLA